MIKKGSNVFYIHGLYGSSSSRKFKFIRERYPLAVCLEWKFNDNIEFYLENTFLRLSKVDGHISLIGSSTGGNFAWQIQQKLLEIGKVKMDWNLVFSFLGSAIGCVAGILASQKLTNYRLEQLEQKVNKHNNLVERMTVNELKIRMMEEKLEENA